MQFKTMKISFEMLEGNSVKFCSGKNFPYTVLCILDGIVCTYCTISLAGTSYNTMLTSAKFGQPNIPVLLITIVLGPGPFPDFQCWMLTLKCWD